LRVSHVGEVSNAAESRIHAIVVDEEPFEAEDPDALSLGLADEFVGRVDLDERLATSRSRWRRARASSAVGPTRPARTTRCSPGGRLRRDKRGRSNKPLRPRPLVSQRQWVSEHLVTRYEARHVLADCGDNSRCFDAEHQRWSAADIPLADPDDLVPVADPCRVHRNHDLIRSKRGWRREFEQAHLVAERVYAGGPHPSHRPPPPTSI
jgi:hypothetical protein